MNHRLTRAMFVVALVFVGGLQLARAETWDVRSQFSADTSIWQYLYMPNADGANGPYTAMELGGGSFPDDGHWRVSDAYTCYLATAILNYPDIRADFGDFLTAVIAWKSPIDGFVDINATVRKQVDGGTGGDYQFYQDNQTTPLVSGSIDGAAESTGLITLSNMPVSVGTQFYLQVDPGANLSTDTFGVMFSVTSVPEPGTLAILGSGLVGLLAYAWRKRK